MREHGNPDCFSSCTSTVLLWHYNKDVKTRLQVNNEKNHPDPEESKRHDLARPGGLEPLAFCSGAPPEAKKGGQSGSRKVPKSTDFKGKTGNSK